MLIIIIITTIIIIIVECNTGGGKGLHLATFDSIWPLANVLAHFLNMFWFLSALVPTCTKWLLTAANFNQPFHPFVLILTPLYHNCRISLWSITVLMPKMGTSTFRKDFVILQLYWWLFSSPTHCS